MRSWSSIIAFSWPSVISISFFRAVSDLDNRTTRLATSDLRAVFSCSLGVGGFEAMGLQKLSGSSKRQMLPAPMQATTHPKIDRRKSIVVLGSLEKPRDRRHMAKRTKRQIPGTLRVLNAEIAEEMKKARNRRYWIDGSLPPAARSMKSERGRTAT